MNSNYKIEIGLTPNYEDNRYKPYHWVIFSLNDSDWCNVNFGWSESQEKAWQEAYDFYLNFINTDK